MHELSVTKALIELVERECLLNHIESPKKIIAELGSLKSYKKESILFYFEILKKDSKFLTESELDIIEVQAKLKCNSCSKITDVTQPYMLFCEHCNSNDVVVMNGKDFKLKEILKNGYNNYKKIARG